MAWTLDQSDVDWSWTGHSSVSSAKGPTRYGGTPARRAWTLKLTHKPTGITVEKTALGPFTRRQAKEAKAQLWQDLFPVLEAKVAAANRISGR